MQGCEGFGCGTYPYIYERREAGAFDVLRRYGGVSGIELECDEVAGWRKSAGQPDSAVSAEGADFEDACGALDTRDQVEEFALVGSDVDRGEASAGVRLYGFVDSLVGVDESADEVFLDGCPEILIHMVTRITVRGRTGKLCVRSACVRGMLACS